MALGHIAAGPITNITENHSDAVACRNYFDAALAYVLGDYDWKFASTKKTLAPITVDGVNITTADLDGWLYLYEYPSNAVKIREILTSNQLQSLDAFGYGNVAGAAYGPQNELFHYNPMPPQRWTNSLKQGFGDDRAPVIPFNVALIGGTQYVFCDVPNARARYTVALGQINAFPADFGILFSYYLAHLVAYQITRKLELKQTMLQAYERMKGMVQADNSNEGSQNREDPPAPWVRARTGY